MMTPIYSWSNFRWFFCIFSLLAAGSIEAKDRLVTKSGEVLIGEILGTENGVIRFRSDVFGEVNVQADQVKVEPASSEAKDAEPEANTGPLTIPGHSAGPKVVETGKKNKTREAIRNFLRLPDGMHVEASLGLGVLSGENDGENFNGNLDVAYDRGRYFNSFGAAYQYGQVNGHRNVDLYEFKLRTVRYFGELDNLKYFSLGQVVRGSDRVRLEDTDTDIYVGVGADLLKKEKIQFRVAVGYSSEWEDFLGNAAAGVPDLPSIHRDKAFLYEDLKVRLGQKLQFEHTGFYMRHFEDSTLYDLKFNSALKYSLTSHLSLSLKHQYEFDNSSAFGIQEDRSMLTLQLGYKL